MTAPPRSSCATCSPSWRERVDVRVLLWAGAPLPLFRPSRRMARRTRARELRRAGPIRCVLDTHERPLHCHHEKTIVIDGRVAFVGGIDLTSMAGDRRDCSRHPARADVGWHDVAAVVDGPGGRRRRRALRAALARGHRRAPARRRRRSPPPDPPPSSSCARSRSTCTRDCDRGSFGILETYARAIRSARELIYLESQYLWSPEIARLLAEKLRDPPNDRFRMLIVLPGKP